ncbi:neuropilin and tolloid-like protein 1 isoform X2 [Mytilus trossulus]|uniref:neuropilin and tolloid-like protein 1 isoform X2 n=1 Tax=Mytilus trossulus TaxID=6551 RepID=UPI003004688D
MIFLQKLTIVLTTLSISSGHKMYMEERCGKKISMDGIGITWMRLKPSRRVHYSPNVNCTVNIETELNKQIVIVFMSIDIEFEPHCDDDFLLLYDGNSTKSKLVNGVRRKVCGSVSPSGSFITTSNVLSVYFKSDAWSNENGFNLVITSFHEGICKANEFHCENGRCISDYLTNDGMNNCGDGSDEFDLSIGAIWGVVVGVFIVTTIGVCIAITSRRRKRKTSKTVKDKKNSVKNEKPWKPEEISPPEGRKSYQQCVHSDISQQFPGIQENSQNIHMESDGGNPNFNSVNCENNSHMNFINTLMEDYVREIFELKSKRSQSVW